MKKLENKVAVITGGNSGIGLATAKEFLDSGAKVLITGRNEEELMKTQHALGNDLLIVRADSSSMHDTQSLGKRIGESVGRIDIVFINAGIGKFSAFEQTDEAFFDEMMDINFKGAYFTIQSLLPLINEGGSIIFNTTINAHIGMAGASVYAASKAALLSLTKNLSAELLSRRIRVNAISPGPVITPLHSAKKLGFTDEQLKAMGESILGKIPLGRFGQPEEIAKIAAFLASDDSSFMLGAELIADGGMYTL